MLRSQLLHRYCYRLFIQFLPVVTDFGGTRFCVIFIIHVHAHAHAHVHASLVPRLSLCFRAISFRAGPRSHMEFL